MGAGAQGAEQVHRLVEIGRAIGEVKQAAGDGAQHGDLRGEVFAADLVEVSEFGLAEALGVEAVPEGVSVAGLGAAFTRSHYDMWKGRCERCGCARR